LIVVADGAIVAVATDAQQIRSLLEAHAPLEVVTLRETEFLAPGMVDCHVHAPQYAYSGTATDKPLMEWLQHYTFPAEKRCEDVEYAKHLYGALVEQLLREGTTCVALYATIHVPATKALVDICLEKGLRAVVGNVCMDRHGGDGYEETTEDALEGTKACLDYIRQAQPGASGLARLVQPCMIPRFIPTCSPELLAGLGAMAQNADDVWVQSHASEAADQIKFVDSLHPGQRCTDIFDSHGLLTNKCVMAHCVYLEVGELDTFAKRGAGVACCPLSNAHFSLSPGWHAFSFHKAHARGVRVGLGTDIAGGYTASILVACRHAVVASKHDVDKDVDYKDAFWAATLGGARALGLDAVLGNFEVGKQFDAIRVNCAAGNYDTFPSAIHPCCFVWKSTSESSQTRFLATTRPCWLNRGETRTATPPSRRRVDGVEVDAMSYDESAANFDFRAGAARLDWSTTSRSSSIWATTVTSRASTFRASGAADVPLLHMFSRCIK